MDTRKSKSNTKVLYRDKDHVHSFTSSESFSHGILPTKKHVIERIMHFKNFRTDEVANEVAKELHARWMWCNVYPLHFLTISKKIQDLVKLFSTLDRWPKVKRNGDSFKTKVDNFMEDADVLFDVFCSDDKQRRKLESEHQLRMNDDDYAFYNDQKGDRVGRCMNEVVELSTSDQKFIRRTTSYEGAATSVIEDPQAGYISDEGSTTTIESSSSVVSEFASSSRRDIDQNRRKWTNLARMCERYQLSDRAAAAIANSVLQDVGLISETNKSMVIDRSKLRRERDKCREEIREEEKVNTQFVDAVYFDGRKDATQVVRYGPNEKPYRSVQLEEHYSVVGEPGEYYLTHLTPINGKGRTIAEDIYKALKDTELEHNLSIVGTDGTASMTGKYNGSIRALEELFNRPLQWVVCLLHANELPLRHVFTKLDGTTNSPDTFTGPIGKNLNGTVSDWPVVAFKKISNPHFPELPQSVVDDLSTDQHYAYRICMAVILGSVDLDLQFLEVGPIVHSRWITLACRILRYFVSVEKPCLSLVLLAEFCIKVYFPSWFEIKKNNKLTHGSINFYNMVQRMVKLPNKKVREIALEVVQRNAFFAHPENVLLAMLGDSDEEIRRLGVNKIQSVRGKLATFNIPNDNFEGGHIVDEDAPNEVGVSDSSIRRYNLPVINLKAKSYYKMVDLNADDIILPPALMNFTDIQIEEMRIQPLDMKHPCHNQSVERHVKLVTEAASQVSGFKRRDGLIRQKIKSRKLMKVFDTKKQFA